MYPEEANKSNNNNKNIINDNDKSNSNKNEDNESKEDNNNNNEEEKPKKKIQKKRHRCWQCRKKMTLAGQFECKCGYVFCSKHRYPDSHQCDFDHKSIHQAKLAKDNCTVAPSKLDKI